MTTHDRDEAVRAISANYQNRPDALIEMMHDIQGEFGCVDDAAVQILAQAINRSRAEVHGVRSFYTDFTDTAKGRCVVRLCRAEACQAAGGEALASAIETALNIKTGETHADGSVSLEAAFCLGDCALSPAAMVNDRLIGRADEQKILNWVRGASDE